MRSSGVYIAFGMSYGIKGELKCFKEVSREFHGSFKGVPRVFQRCFKEVSRKLSGCFKKFSCCMALIAASRAEGGLVL